MINNKLELFKQEIKGKKISVIGIGVSNIPAIKYLNNLGGYIIARDKSSEIPEELKDLENIEFILGEEYLSGLKESDYIFRSPGIKPFLPEIKEAVDAGVILTSEIETFINITPAHVIAVTGSDGKTTTTTLTYKFLEEAGKKVYVGGNIGIPLLDKVEEMTEDDYVVLELSSFQLMTLAEKIDRAAITNISPNHLDYHNDYEEYINSKANIFKGQDEFGLLVLNADDNMSDRYEVEAKGKISKFSIKKPVEDGVYYENGKIIASNNCITEEIVDTSEIKIVGMHNVANICTACSLILDICGKEVIQKVVRTFPGVEHRMEFVREKNGVKWYNDSLASSPTRTMSGLKAFNKKIILIAGGYDKKIPYDVMGPHIMDEVKILVLVGATADKIRKAVEAEAEKRKVECIKIVEFDNLKSAVNYCNENSQEGDIVSMSPASASFDLYKNAVERGLYFKELVNQLN